MPWMDYQNGIFAFDAQYVRPHLAAIHLVVDGGRAALIDTGAKAALPATLSALERVGMTPDAVDYICLTHIHLDHAGGAGSLMQAFPNARLVVHPRGSRHMADPTKLLEGVRAVYGADETAERYGDILPIHPARIIEAQDEQILTLGNRRLRCLDTPGHARHHLCFVDEQTGGVFTGDVFGISYRELDAESRPFIFPTTTPVQFEPALMKASIERILALQPEACYLTHYARVETVQTLGRTLCQQVDDFCSMALAAPGEGPARHCALQDALTRYLLDAVRAHGCVLSEPECLEILKTDIELNAQGLGIWRDSLASR